MESLYWIPGIFVFWKGRIGCNRRRSGNMQSRKAWEWIDVLFLAGLLAGLLLYLSRIRWGYAEMDESYFLTVPYRLIQGDALLRDDWHPTQLIGFLLYPIMKCYLLLRGSTEGIYLGFRYIYVISHFLAALAGYVLLRGRDKIAALASNLIFFLYTVFNTMSLGYNSMGLTAVWLWIAVALCKWKRFPIRGVCLGLLLAVAVLCNPYMVFAYVIYAGICVRKRNDDVFGIRSFWGTTLGAGILFMVFCAFIFSRASFGELLQNIPFLFKDATHGPSQILRNIKSVIWFSDWFRPYFITLFIGAIAAMRFRKWSAWIFAGLSAVSALCSLVLAVFKTEGIGRLAIMLPLTMLGLIAFLLTEHKSWDVMQRGWMVGVLYSLSLIFSSDQGVYAICWASTASSAASVFLIKDYLQEQEGWNFRWPGLALLIVGQLCSQIYLLRNYVYYEDNRSELTSEIEEGPMRGVLTTEAKKRIYAIDYENISGIKDLDGKNLLIFNEAPEGYLIAQTVRNGGPSGWMCDYKSLDDRKLQEYYELHTDKIPDIIYVNMEFESGWNDEKWRQWCEDHGYVREVFSKGGAVLRRNEN